MKLTATIILNWNGFKDTIACLDSLMHHLDPNDYIFVVDNGSTDTSVHEIEGYFQKNKWAVTVSGGDFLQQVFTTDKKVYLVTNSENLGFGAGINVVLKKLGTLSRHFELAWLLNNDAKIMSATLTSLKSVFHKNENIGAAGSLILNYPDEKTIQCSGVNHYKFFGVSKLINKNKPLAELDRGATIKFDYLNGASLMLNLRALETVGYFDERFFLYSEELDLQLRIQKSNYRLYLDLNSVVSHKLGGATSRNRHLFFYYYNTSAILLSRKHFSVVFTFCAVFNLTAITFIRTFPSLKSFKWGIKGIKKGLKAH